MELIEPWQKGCATANQMMNDYKRIRNSDRGYKKLRAIDTKSIHTRSVAALTDFLEANDTQKTIVVTHHAPSILSLPERRRGEPISCAYASALDDLILRHQPPLWIHGHIHHSNDYHIGNTRILANPQAYPDEPNPNFNPELIIEV
ncbi:MAG: hypothetical protein AAF226_08150 [Verrucomicrobiota bacterium]